MRLSQMKKNLRQKQQKKIVAKFIHGDFGQKFIEQPRSIDGLEVLGSNPRHLQTM